MVLNLGSLLLLTTGDACPTSPRISAPGEKGKEKERGRKGKNKRERERMRILEKVADRMEVRAESTQSCT